MRVYLETEKTTMIKRACLNPKCSDRHVIHMFKPNETITPKDLTCHVCLRPLTEVTSTAKRYDEFSRCDALLDDIKAHKFDLPESSER